MNKKLLFENCITKENINKALDKVANTIDMPTITAILDEVDGFFNTYFLKEFATKLYSDIENGECTYHSGLIQYNIAVIFDLENGTDLNTFQNTLVCDYIKNKFDADLNDGLLKKIGEFGFILKTVNIGINCECSFGVAMFFELDLVGGDIYTTMINHAKNVLNRPDNLLNMYGHKNKLN